MEQYSCYGRFLFGRAQVSFGCSSGIIPGKKRKSAYDCSSAIKILSWSGFQCMISKNASRDVGNLARPSRKSSVVAKRKQFGANNSVPKIVDM